jgi:protein-disulfide isomerase
MSIFRLVRPCFVGFAVFTFTPMAMIEFAHAQASTASYAREPVSLPDMALGPRGAPVTIVEYSSMTCLHCANFELNEFPQLKAKYIDTGRVRFIYRELPLDTVAAGASMLARCAASGDPGRYFHTVDQLFRQQSQLIDKPTATLTSIGRQNGMTDQQTEACLSDQQLLDHLRTDEKIAVDIVKVKAAPTFFINDQMYTGTMPFESMDRIIAPMLR